MKNKEFRAEERVLSGVDKNITLNFLWHFILKDEHVDAHKR